jgi:hypothetical protein
MSAFRVAVVVTALAAVACATAFGSTARHLHVSTGPGPGFRSAAGWHRLQNGLSAPPLESVATAATVPIAKRDRGQSDPSHTVASLPRGGVVLWIQFFPRRPEVREKYFPQTHLPLRLADTAALKGRPEGFPCGASGCGQTRALQARAEGYDITVFVFFGRAHPSAAQRLAAGKELARLALPGCPTGIEPLRTSDLRLAASATLHWLSQHWFDVGVASKREIRAAHASARLIATSSSDRRVRVAAQLCGHRAERVVAVTVKPSALGRKTLGSNLLYFVAKTPHGWLVWRQG